MSGLGLASAAVGPDGLDLLERFALPILLAAFAFAGAVVGVLLGQWAAERERRRAGYAAAMRDLIAWHEYPYRIRRRTDNNAETLRALAERGHKLQEDLIYHQTWTIAESRRVGEFYARMVAEVAGTCAQACKDAWNADPADSPAAMNLNGWGPPSIDPQITVLQAAIANRFGWRRALGMSWWSRLGK